MEDLSPLALDLQRRQLRLGNETVVLRSKEAAVLQYLIERSGKVVSASELQKAVWPGIKVGADTLKTLIYALRKRLGDSSQQPRYIENVPRHGYRFIGHLTHPPPLSTNPDSEDELPVSSQSLTSSIVGRKVELATLSNLLAKALTGQRQVVFITGEPGIGKTTLVETFLQQLSSTPTILVACSQCVEQYGGREAYRPLLEAIGQLYQKDGSKERLTLLHRHAPMVLAQLPTLLSSAERQRLQREILGVPQERMLREFLAVVEVLSHSQPLVMILEDLHWSDPSTIDVLSAFAQRNDPARVLVIGTYREIDALRDEHPMHAAVQALLEHGQCRELSVPSLTEAEVTSYLVTRFASSTIVSKTLSTSIRQRTAGNPLFLNNLVDDLLLHSSFAQNGNVQDGIKLFSQLAVPRATTQLIERQLRRLTPAEQDVLKAASIAGKEFSAAAVAAGLHQDIMYVEAICEGLLLRQQFIQRQGTRRIPERRHATRYSFRHALYCEVFALSIPAARYRQLHRRIEQWKEKTYGASAPARSTEVPEPHEESYD